MPEVNKQKDQEARFVKTFNVPFSLGEVKENITISTAPSPNQLKEEIITKAFKFHSQGNISEAAKNYQYFINQGYKDHRVFSNYGVILKDLGKLKEAEIFQYKAIEIKPDFANAYTNLGNILRDLGRSKEAESYIRKAIKLKPNFAEAHANLGTILRDLGNLDGALKYYSNAISLRSDYNDALMNRAQLFFERKEFNKALKDIDSCNTENSRAFALETLFALGRIDEIYERIKKISGQDDKNIRLAAFSSFISNKEKKNTAHNFCQNPLSFLHVSNLKSYLNDYDEFINEIINELSNIKVIWEPKQNTTVNGFHSPVHINHFSNPSGKISQLKSIISKELDAYYLKYEKESCSYINKWPYKKNLKAWHVILKKQGYQKAHIHPSGWLSGVVYLKVVPSLGKDEGAIEFSLNGENYSNPNSPQLIHHPEAGDIVLFPSSLYHRTIPFSTDTERIVMAFDLMPN